MDTETASQRKWRLIREAQEAKAADLAKARRAKRTTRPAYGSQQWAETYRDDLGESPDF